MFDHTDHTTTDQTTPRPATGLRRAVALGAVAAFGLLAPAAAGASPVSPSEPPPPGPGDIQADPGCQPDLPCDVDPEPEPCDPMTEICGFTSGGNGPDDPCEADEPPAECEPTPGGEGDPDPEPVPTGEVDEPVQATPNFTG